MDAPNTSKTVDLGDGKINEEGLERMRGLIGTSLRVNNQFNDLASRTAIRNFINGIGDDNPLYRDPEYAAKTAYGRIIAPASWLYSVFPTWVPMGLPGVHGFHAGNDWEFYRPVFEGDLITPEYIYRGFDVKNESQFAGRTIINKGEARFSNSRGQLVAKAGQWSVRAERSAARSSGKYAKIQLPHPWTEEELKQVDRDILQEEVRGSKPRFWEEVEVGEQVGPLTKGPFGLTDMIAYCVGALPVQAAAHRVQLRTYAKHPAWGFRDPMTCAMEPIFAVHYNTAAANNAGLPYPYDAGVQRNSWMIHLFTDWMGDDGWLKKCYAEYRRFVYLSDVVRFAGKVTRKYVDEDGDYCVEIQSHGINQRGEDTIPGRAVVALPSKTGAWPVLRRL